MRSLTIVAIAACMSLATLAAPVGPPLPSATPPPSLPEFRCEPPEPQPKGAALDVFCRTQHADADACVARGGAWWSYGLAPPGTRPWCHLPTPDAGRVCTSNSQCRASTCTPDGTAYSAAPGKALGHCDRYGNQTRQCATTVENGVVVTPKPCPLI
jgi:hypothetical protein